MTETDFQELSSIYLRDREGMADWRDTAMRSHNELRAVWPNQSIHQRKDYPGAMPWQGASDQQVFTIAPRVQTVVAIMMNAISNGQISVFPSRAGADDKSAAASAFIRWMFDRWMPDAKEQIELSLYNMVNKGLCATWVGWEQQTQEFNEVVELEQLSQQAEADPENAGDFLNLIEAIIDEEREDEAVSIMENQFSVKKSVARKAVRELRQKGIAEVPMISREFDRPVIESLDIATDIIVPAYTTNIRYLSRIHVRQFMTEDTLISKADAQEWDTDIAEKIAKEGMGITLQDIDKFGFQQDELDTQQEQHDLAEIVRTYRRITDEKTGAIGIYETIWCPKISEGVLSHKLMNGWDEFPVVFTPLFKDTKRLFDSKGLAYYLRGNQRQSKVSRDGFSDQLSITMNPPRRHPPGRPPSAWGAGATYAVQRGFENSYGPEEVPNTMREGVAMEEFLEKEANFISGLLEDRISVERQQYIVNRALHHVASLARIAYRMFTQYYRGNEIYFQITGRPEQFTYQRTSEDLEIDFFFDVRTNDPKFVQETTDFLTALRNFDTTGRIDPSNLIDVMVNLRAPQFATRLLRSQEEAQEDVIRNVASDLALIWSGQSVPARQQGAQIALQYIEQYTQKPSVAARLQSDAQFAEDLANYVGRYEFQMQQLQNAQIGRTGGEPTDLEQAQPEL